MFAGVGGSMKLGLALHIGVVCISGRPLNTLWALPVTLLRHLGADSTSRFPTLRRCDRCIRTRILSSHQHPACETAGFRWTSEPSAER